MAPPRLAICHMITNKPTQQQQQVLTRDLCRSSLSKFSTTQNSESPSNNNNNNLVIVTKLSRGSTKACMCSLRQTQLQTDNKNTYMGVYL